MIHLQAVISRRKKGKAGQMPPMYRIEINENGIRLIDTNKVGFIHRRLRSKIVTLFYLSCQAKIKTEIITLSFLKRLPEKSFSTKVRWTFCKHKNRPGFFFFTLQLLTVVQTCFCFVALSLQAVTPRFYFYSFFCNLVSLIMSKRQNIAELRSSVY